VNEDQGKTDLKKTIVQGGVAIVIVIIVAGAISGHIWATLGLVASGAIGLSLSVYVNKRLDAEK